MKEKDRGLIRNFTIVVYPDTLEKYLHYKESNKLTHDEALNKLLDRNEQDDKNEKE